MMQALNIVQQLIQLRAKHLPGEHDQEAHNPHKDAAEHAKEPWELSYAEVKSRARELYGKEGFQLHEEHIRVYMAEHPQPYHLGATEVNVHRKTPEGTAWLKKFDKWSAQDQEAILRYLHGRDIKKALDSGKKVPDNVLADYPDLAGKQ